MRKNKALLYLTLALSILICVAALVSCGGGGDVKTDTGSSNQGGGGDDGAVYKVTVVDESGAPVKNAYVQICQGDICFKQPIVTGEDGSGTMTIKENGGKIKATLLEVAGDSTYLEGEAVYFENGSKELTIVAKKGINYTVKVVDTENNPIKNAYVQICQGENCFKQPIVTGEDGIGSRLLEDNGEKVKVTVLEVEGDEYIITGNPAYFENGSTVTITLTKSVSYKLTLTNGEDKVKDATVKLYGSDNELVAELTTGVDGVAEFTALTPDDYYAVITHINGAFGVKDKADGKVTLAESEMTVECEFGVSRIEYKVTVKDTNGKLLSGVSVKAYTESGAEATGATTDENGVATVQIRNGDYAFITMTNGEIPTQGICIFEKYGATEGRITVDTRFAQGATNTTAIPVIGSKTVTTKANGTVRAAVCLAAGKKIVVTGEGVVIRYNSTDYISENGTVEIEITEDLANIQIEDTSGISGAVRIEVKELFE